MTYNNSCFTGIQTLNKSRINIGIGYAPGLRVGISSRVLHSVHQLKKEKLKNEICD